MFGPPDIERLKARHRVRALVKALRYRGLAAVRAGAARALGELGDQRAIAPLIEVLSRDSHDVRRAAGGALVRLGGTALAPLLAAETACRERDESVFLAAASQLASAGHDEVARQHVLDLCLAALRVDGPEPLREAADGLERLGWHPAADADGAAFWIARGQWSDAATLGDAAVDELLRALGGRAQEARLAAAVALGDAAARCTAPRGRTKLAQGLVSALQDAQGELPAVLLTSLGQVALCLQDPGDQLHVVAVLADRLDHWSHPVRVAAAAALVKAFRHGNLDDACRQRVLAERERMARPHTDRLIVDDYCRREPGIGWYHVDTATHVDEGIGVEL